MSFYPSYECGVGLQRRKRLFNGQEAELTLVGDLNFPQEIRSFQGVEATTHFVKIDLLDDLLEVSVLEESRHKLTNHGLLVLHCEDGRHS